MDTEAVVNAYMCVRLPKQKKNEILPSAKTWTDVEGIIMLREISQRKTNTVHYCLHVESKKMKQMDEYNKTETDSQIKRTN